jgi:PAT family beta-lactamase induction signal transducer AmpG
MLTGYSSVLIMQDLGWSVEKNATWSGIATWMGLFGSIGGGLLADRMGPRRLAMVAGTGLALSNLIFADSRALWQYDSFIIGQMFLDSLLSGLLYVSLFTLCMKVSWPMVAATQFTAYMALLNLSRTIGQDLTGRIEDSVTVQGAFALAAALQVAPLLLLALVDPGQTRRVLGGGDD